MWNQEDADNLEQASNALERIAVALEILTGAMDQETSSAFHVVSHKAEGA